MFKCQVIQTDPIKEVSTVEKCDKCPLDGFCAFSNRFSISIIKIWGVTRYYKEIKGSLLTRSTFYSDPTYTVP
jgi:hypothetical protein